MPDPKPKKKVAAPPQQPADAPAQISVDDYNSQLAAPEQGTDPQFGDVSSGSTSTAPSPVEGFWQRLVHGYSGEGSRVVEAAKGAARGVVNAGRETANTLNEMATATGAVKQVPTEGFSAPSTDSQVEHYLGKRSDDPLAGFTESVSQFTTGWAATGELKLLKGAKLATMLLRGALVDATAFNPREAQLAELAAKAPVPVVKQIGELLSVKGDDSQAVARLKRAAAGMVPVTAIEGLVNGARLLRGTRVLASATATPVEKAAAQESVSQSADALQKLSDGTYALDGQVIKVAPIKEGGYTLETAKADMANMQVVSNGPMPQAQYEVSIEGIKSKATTSRPTTGPSELGYDQVLQMSPEQISAAAEAATKAEKNAPVQIWGEEGAKRYEAAQRTLNSQFQFDRVKEEAAMKTVTEMESKLNPDQEKLLFGIGQKGYNAEELTAIAGDANYYSHASELSTEDLLNTFGREMSTGDPLKNAGHAIRLRAVAKELETRGLSIEDAIKGGIEQRVARGHASAEDAIALTQSKWQQLAAKFSGKSPTAETPRLLFSSRAEAEQQAESMNHAITERENVGTISPEATTRVEEAAKSFGSDSGAALSELVKNPDLNVSIHNSVEDNMKLISDLSDKISSNIRQSVAANGQVSVEDAFNMAHKLIGNVSEAEAPELLKTRLGDFEGQSVWSLSSHMVVKDIGQKIAKMSEVLDARPHDPVIVGEARDAVMNYFKLTEALYHSDSDAARTLRFLQEGDNPLGSGVKFRDANGTPAPLGTTAVEDVAGLKTRDASQKALDEANVRTTARMIRMADGEPRNMEAVINGSKVFKNTHQYSKALEVFTNFLLSGPKTWLTVPTSGATVTAFEPVVKMAAGLATANRALAQEGADIMWANFKYLNDNLGIAVQSFREGRSIINPAPQHIAIGGMTGQLIRTPSRILTGLDELTRVTNYRSYVRAKSLRIGREQGLTGAALEARAESDVRAAFDPETGIATIPDALKYADVPTFSGPLGKDTFGGKFHEFTNNAVEAKFIAPFIKASVNIFRYVWKSTPGLNLLNKQSRAIMAAGGEEAAVLHARSAIAGSIYGVGLYNALSGNLTGRGPTDPNLRALWLKNHQPYSVRVGGEWVSYRRADPLATPLGLIADLSTFIGELGHKDLDAEDFAYATVAAMVSNLGSKTYMQGITEFAQAWGAGDSGKVKQWFQNFAGNITVPQIVSSFNDDPYYREVRTMGDAIMSRVPGFSDKLDPRYDIFGEPTLKAPWLLNRAANVFTLKPIGSSVEDDLQALDKGLAPMPQKLFGGFIDLSDKDAFDNGTHVSPYSRMMQLVRSPADGSQSLRDAMGELVKSDKWKDASDGVTLIPGGARWIYAAAIKDKYEQKALKEVLDEYPKLQQKYEGIQRLRGAAITGGEAGVADVEAMFGVKLQK